MINGNEFFINFPNNEYLSLAYEIIALFNSAMVFYFLYAVLGKPLPKPLYLLWLLPFFHQVANYLIRTYQPQIYEQCFYESWYVDFPFYVKILFTILLVGQLRVFNREIAENSTPQKTPRLNRLYLGKYFVCFHLLLSVLLLGYLFFTLTNGRLYNLPSPSFTYSATFYNMINRSCTMVFLLIFAYQAFQNPAILNLRSAGFQLEPQLAETTETIAPAKEEKLQTKPEISEEQASQYRVILNTLMAENNVYLDPKLSLNKLARLSSISSRQLSKFIQQSSQKNFKEYINHFRVSHAKKLLIQNADQQYTMYSVAFDSGFNSESSFYKIFKEETGMTPKQYQETFA